MIIYSLVPDYIHLYMDHAKINIVYSASKLNLKGIFQGQVRKKYNTAIKNITQYTQANLAMDNSMTEAMSAQPVFDLSTPEDIDGAAAYVSEIKAKANKLSAAMKVYNSVVVDINKINTSIMKNLQTIALQDEQFRLSLGITVPSGMYTVTSNLESKIESQIQVLNPKINSVISILGDVAVSGAANTNNITINNFIVASKKIVVCINELLQKTETLKGLLQALEQGNRAINSIEKVSSNVIITNDTKISSDIAKAKQLIKDINFTLGAISTQQSNSELIFNISDSGGCSIFGVTVENISQRKFNAMTQGSALKRDAIELGSTGKSLLSIMKQYNATLSSALGGQEPILYSKQLLAGLEMYQDPQKPDPVKDGHKYSSYTAAWNQVTNMCSLLTLTDALSTFSKKTSTVGATYYVVNNQVFRIDEILNAVINNLSNGYATGVFGMVDKDNNITKSTGVAIQRKNYQVGKAGYRSLAIMRSSLVSTEFDKLFSSVVLKTKISLGALIKYSGLSAI
jgi:vacuolar-type H+-ATPase subunit D/Vma8